MARSLGKSSLLREQSHSVHTLCIGRTILHCTVIHCILHMLNMDTTIRNELHMLDCIYKSRLNRREAYISLCPGGPRKPIAFFVDPDTQALKGKVHFGHLETYVFSNGILQ